MSERTPQPQIRLFQHVTDPPLEIRDRTFSGGVVILGSPIYGRVLFRQHDVSIADSDFTMGADGIALALDTLMGTVVTGCRFHAGVQS